MPKGLKTKQLKTKSGVTRGLVGRTDQQYFAVQNSIKTLK